MKKPMMYLAGAFLLGGVLMTEACKKPDEEKPTLTLSEPEDGETFDSGQEIHVEGTAKDNKELSQLKIDIHDAFDGHSHGRLASGATAFSVIRVVNLSGKEYKFHEDISIPVNTLAGKYHVTVSVVDEAGNLSNVIERDIYIRNSTDLIPPVVTVTAPTADQTVMLNGSLQVQASILDNEEIEEVKIKIKNAAGTKVFEWESDHLHVSEYTLDHTANLTGLPAGSYKLEVVAIDHVNNITEVDVNFVIQ